MNEKLKKIIDSNRYYLYKFNSKTYTFEMQQNGGGEFFPICKRFSKFS